MNRDERPPRAVMCPGCVRPVIATWQRSLLAYWYTIEHHFAPGLAGWLGRVCGGSGRLLHDNCDVCGCYGLRNQPCGGCGAEVRA
jgi:hypothetical protein